MGTSSILRYRSLGIGGLLGVALWAGGCGQAMVDTRGNRETAARLYNDGQYAEAIGACRNNIARNSADYISHYYLAASLAKTGAYDEAIQQYKTTLNLMKTSLEGRDDHDFRMKVLDALAVSVVKANEREQESAAIAKAPRSAENQFLLAKIDRMSGDADAAVEAYEQAALLAPRDFIIAKEYGLYLEKVGQTDRARSELRKAYALNDQDPQVTSALRRVGVVPGPSLKDENDLAKPVIPVGPIPEVELGKPQQQNPNSSATASPRE